jgi:hypothetical protein
MSVTCLFVTGLIVVFKAGLLGRAACLPANTICWSVVRNGSLMVFVWGSLVPAWLVAYVLWQSVFYSVKLLLLLLLLLQLTGCADSLSRILGRSLLNLTAASVRLSSRGVHLKQPTGASTANCCRCVALLRGGCSTDRQYMRTRSPYF